MTETPDWRWELLQPHDDHRRNGPGPRDIWNGVLSHEGSLYVFGGATARYGPATKEGDLTTLGTLNDLWQYDPRSGVWEPVEEDDGRSGYSGSDRRPSGRVLPAWLPVGDRLYLYGGLSVTGEGWRTILLNDLWRLDPTTRRWELLEPHDGRALASPTDRPGSRPTTLAAMGAAAIGEDLYMVAGWAGQASGVVMSPQLWCYRTAADLWEFLGPHPEAGTGWPGKRYCPAFTAWRGKLYLWGGRDTQYRRPEYYNDLWEYDPDTCEWACLMANRPGDPNAPSPRYGAGHGCIGGRWSIFGGFGSSSGNGPQLNDLWAYDFRSGAWDCLQAHDGSKDYSRDAERPGIRRVPGTAVVEDALYLFAGIDLASGPNDDGPTVAFNDLWRGSPES